MTGLKAYSLVGGFGNVRAAKYDYACKPAHPLTGGYGAILMHQAGTLYTGQFAGSATPVSSEIPGALARVGIPSIAGELNGSVGGDGFGNPSTMTDMDAARVRLGTLNPTISASKVHLVGFSMGLHACLRYALTNPTRVASITGVVGLTDIMNAYDNVPAQQVPMRTAWAVADRAGLAASAANIYAGLSALAGTPVQMFYSAADTTIAPSTQTGAAAAIGSSATATQVSASLDHVAAEQIAGLVRDLVDAPRGYAGNWTALTKFMLDHDAV